MKKREEQSRAGARFVSEHRRAPCYCSALDLPRTLLPLYPCRGPAQLSPQHVRTESATLTAYTVPAPTERALPC